MQEHLTTLAGLAAAQKQVSSLWEAKEWVSAARMHMARLAAVADDCDAVLLSLPDLHAAARTSAQQRPWWARLLPSKEQRKLKSAERDAKARKQKTIATSEAIQGLIDDTPTNEAERAVLLKELKSTKKSLQIDKREVGTQLREIRADARRKSTRAATGLIALTTDRKYTAMERRSIRAQKERAVAGPEQIKLLIEKQLLDLDRQIARIEKLQ